VVSGVPKLSRVLETCLYVDDLERASRFYEDVLELPRIAGDESRFRGYDVGGLSVLLLFLRGGTLEPVELPGGVIPPHDGSGPQHFAFAVEAAELPAWERRLSERGIALEGDVKWPRGGRSIYFRDPDAHVIELATPGLWTTY
jgi:catechol 2,3-dioxygenase-like lactoylglutathione lyase family enzyme